MKCRVCGVTTLTQYSNNLCVHCDFELGSGKTEEEIRASIFTYSGNSRPKIIACDFDGTLFTDAYPGVGEPIFLTIEMLKAEQEEGAKIILWTNRSDEPLENAINACKEENLFFDAINDNLPEIIKIFGCNTRKIFADEYWDDRMVQIPRLKHPGKIELKCYER